MSAGAKNPAPTSAGMSWRMWLAIVSAVIVSGLVVLRAYDLTRPRTPTEVEACVQERIAEDGFIATQLDDYERGCA